MKSKSINFGSIFRRQDGPRQTDSKERAGRGSLLERFAERRVTLKEGDVIPLAKDTPSLDWTTVNGRITVLVSTIDGLLEGRTRIKAQQLKNLKPCPIDRETEDSIEYAVSLAAIVSQIDDLLSDDQPKTGQPEFETPFTVLTREDNARFEHDARQTAIPEREPEKQPTLRWVPELQPLQLDEDLARRGVERLQEIFMTSRPLDGRRVASLVQELPGINGALILLEGGVVLGGQLPESLSLEAALQAPEVLRNFRRFIGEIEAEQRAQSEFVTVTAATTISLVASGEIVLLVSYQGRTLPPGVAKRLTETAEALNLIYGNHQLLKRGDPASRSASQQTNNSKS